LEHPDILATIAGDNTVFIAPHSTRVIPKLTQTLRRFITED
jgi:arginine repressor